jgi:eukaryotic translation initiation factor 2C
MAVNKYDSDELIREFGLNFNPQLLKVSARILDAPTLVFGEGRKENPRDGKWNFNNKQLMQGCNIPNWVVAVFDGRCHDGGNIAQSLVQACNRRGMVHLCLQTCQSNHCFLFPQSSSATK